MLPNQPTLSACFRFCCIGLLSLVCLSCTYQQPKSFYNVVTEDDSIAIRIDTSRMVTCHSSLLGMRFQYPSFLMRQPADPTDNFELFMCNDISFTIMKDTVGGNFDDFVRSTGQQFMGMGAELLEATDRYSIHRGNEKGFDYYAKVIDDSTRLVTLILRYYPKHEYAVGRLRDWVRAYDPLEPQP